MVFPLPREAGHHVDRDEGAPVGGPHPRPLPAGSGRPRDGPSGVSGRARSESCVSRSPPLPPRSDGSRPPGESGLVVAGSLQQKRIEDRAVARGELRVDRIEPGGVVRGRGWGSHHAGEEHRETALGRMPSKRSRFARVTAGSIARRPSFAPRATTTACGSSARAHSVRASPAAGGIAGHPRVDHAGVEPERTKRGLQPGGKRVARREPVARGEAVAEHQNADRAILRADGRGSRRHRRRGEERRGPRPGPPAVPRAARGSRPAPAPSRAPAGAPTGKEA